jgi:phosphopantetheinyl transferase
MKEAILKSTGHGLDIDPREIVLLPGSLEPIISLPTALPAKSSFRFHEWQSDQNTLSALVWVQRNPDVPREEIAEIQFEHIAVQQLYSGLYLTSGQNSD